MLRGDAYVQGLWFGAEAQRRVELEGFAVDAGCDGPVRSDFERWCGPFEDAFVSAPGWVCAEDGDPELAGVEAGSSAGAECAAESVGVVGDQHDRAGVVVAAVRARPAESRASPPGPSAVGMVSAMVRSLASRYPVLWTASA
jgi:hypothetical protein